MTEQFPSSDQPSPGEFLLYQTAEGNTRIECRFAEDSIWLTQRQISELFQTSVPNVNQHLKTIYEDGELKPDATIKKYLIVQTEGTRQISRHVEHYNLDAILAVGFRVRSHRGIQFRTWATQRLREYLIKGFTMDDQRLKEAGGGAYFEELLERIRDIRSSEKVFWRKILEIYATSIDYEASDEASTLFFKTIQNKMHWAAHGHTAAEIIYKRTDESQPNSGLTSWTGDRVKKSDVSIAKNYLKQDELNALNRIVSAYLEFAEIQALNRTPMTMANWIVKLDDFLKLSGRELLDHAGMISHDQAKLKAETAFESYRQKQANLSGPVDQHFDQALNDLKRLNKENPD